MKTLFLLSLILLSVPVFAQDAPARQPKLLDPAKVLLAVQGERRLAAELDGLIRAEIQQRRDMALVTKRPNLAVDINVAPIMIDGQVVGYAAALLVSGKKHDDYLAVVIEADLPQLARALTYKLPAVRLMAAGSK